MTIDQTIQGIAEDAGSATRAARWARQEADAIISQLERRAKGYDQGMYRDDDPGHYCPIQEQQEWHSEMAFALAERWA